MNIACVSELQPIECPHGDRRPGEIRPEHPLRLNSDKRQPAFPGFYPRGHHIGKRRDENFGLSFPALCAQDTVPIPASNANVSNKIKQLAPDLLFVPEIMR